MDGSEKKITARVIAKCWTDEDFKSRLLKNPREVLEEEGIEAREGVEIRLVQNTKAIRYFVIPEAPEMIELSEDEIDERAAMLLEDQIEMF
jgi:hypothetical protein